MDIPWFLDYPLHKLRLQISMFFSAITPSEPRLPQVGGRSSWISPRADGSYAYTYKILQEQPNIKHLCRSLIVNYCKLTKMMHELQLSWSHVNRFWLWYIPAPCAAAAEMVQRNPFSCHDPRATSLLVFWPLGWGLCSGWWIRHVLKIHIVIGMIVIRIYDIIYIIYKYICILVQNVSIM